MTQEEIIYWAEETFAVSREYLFSSEPDFAVLRRSDNRKWFALFMNLPGDRLGIPAEQINVVNLKCDPIASGSIRELPGVFPAYHMSKAHWITVLLDGTVDFAMLEMLFSMSYDLTAPKSKKQKATAE